MALETDQTILRRLIYRASAVRLHIAAADLLQLHLKANFNPNQPRVPRGHPTGGRWTRVGAAEGAPIILVGDGADPTYDPPEEDLDPSELPDFSGIPDTRPGGLGERYDIIRNLPLAAFDRSRRRNISELLARVPVPQSVREYYPYIDAYRAPPKTLQQMRSEAQTAKPGYDRHHIVERTSAYSDGFSRSMIEHPENIVLISTFKHWAITAWYAKKNPAFGGVSPREYLRGKSRSERQKVGLQALKDAGVLE